MGLIQLQTPIRVHTKGQKRDTTLGRVFFNEILPKEYPYDNEVQNSKHLKKVMANILDQFGAEERNVSGVTLGVNRQGYEAIVHELDACRKKIISIAANCGKLDQVYRLNLQFFPLTKKVKSEKED